LDVLAVPVAAVLLWNHPEAVVALVNNGLFGLSDLAAWLRGANAAGAGPLGEDLLAHPTWRRVRGRVRQGRVGGDVSACP